MNETLFVVIPAYNEEEALPGVLDGWYPIVERCPDSRLIVVDDGSTDDTARVLDGYCAAHSQAVAVRKPNGGHGSAIWRGYRLAVDHEGLPAPSWVFQTDSDGQTDPAEFDLLWERAVEGFDAVMGYRRSREDGVSRVAVTRVLRAVVLLTMRVRLDDANVPFRLMRADALEEALGYVPEEHNLTNVLLSVALARTGKRVCSVPVSFRARTQGVNSINLRKIFGIGARALRDFREFDRVMLAASITHKDSSEETS